MAILGSEFSLPEMRVLWEVAHLSRILRGFRERGLMKAEASEFDARVRHLKLTTRGLHAMLPLEKKSSAEVKAIIGKLSGGHRDRLVAAMRAIETLLEPKAGDSFEALVAGIVARFIRDFKPAREHCWIAESEGEKVGCVFLVEPSARGMGIGSTLVDECIRFARNAGYRKVILWTNSVPHAARHLYERTGFKRVKQEKHHSFGHDLVGQTFSLSLGRESEHR